MPVILHQTADGSGHGIGDLWITNRRGSPVDNEDAVRAGRSSVERMTWNVPGFSVERRLGEGATGEVWAGRDDVTGQPVALKRLRPGGGEIDGERLRREAALLASFRHPHVIGVRGVLGGEGGLVLVLDLAAGGSLAQLLAQHGRLRSGQVVAVFAPLAAALAAAHRSGLVHGDVSPGNILFDGDGRPLLADLGTARLIGDDAAPTHGTSGYIDPVVCAGASPTSASDIYSLAAVAARALTGRPLSEGPDAVQLWAERAFARGVPSALVLALSQALDRDPVHRPDAATLATRIGGGGPAEPLTSLVAPDTGGGSGVAHATPPRSDVLADSVAIVGPRPDAPTRRVPRPARPPEPVPRRRWWARWRRRPATASGARPAVARGPRRLLPARSARLPGTPPPARRAGVRWAAAATAVVTLAGVAGFAWLAADRPPPAAPPLGEQAGARPVAGEVRSPGSAGEWVRLLSSLDGRREQAFAQADARLLDDVYAAGSPPLATDQHAVRSLVTQRASALPVRHDIGEVRVLRAAANGAQLEVNDRMPGYRIVDAGGATLRTVPPRAERTFKVELVRLAAGWRIALLTELSAPG